MPRRAVGPDGLTDQEREAVTLWFGGMPMVGAVKESYKCKSAAVAQKLAYEIFHKPRVQKAIREMFKVLDKKGRLTRKALLKNLGDSMGRDLHDLAEICPAVLKIPKHAHVYIRGIKTRQYHDDPEDPSRVTHEDVEIKIGDVTSERDQAFRVRGMYAATKTQSANINGTVSDWNAFLKAVDDSVAAESRPVETKVIEQEKPKTRAKKKKSTEAKDGD